MKDFITNFDEKTLKITFFTQKLAFFISLLGVIGLFICLKIYTDLNLYYISIAIFKTGILAAVCSLCFGIFFNIFKKRYIPR